jgi:hypothetical protein
MDMEIQICRTLSMVKPVVVCGVKSWPVTERGSKTEYVEQEYIKKDAWASDRTRNVESKK